jgi:hypothetical protein
MRVGDAHTDLPQQTIWQTCATIVLRDPVAPDLPLRVADANQIEQHNLKQLRT